MLIASRAHKSSEICERSRLKECKAGTLRLPRAGAHLDESGIELEFLWLTNFDLSEGFMERAQYKVVLHRNHCTRNF
jgi:hypothetical protein